MKLDTEQQAALDELCETFVQLRANADTYGNHDQTTTAAKALWTDASQLISRLDPNFNLRERLQQITLTNGGAVAIKVGKRYYVRHGKRDRVITAWSLAGAQLFLPNTTQLDTAYAKLCQSGHRPRVITVMEAT